MAFASIRSGPVPKRTAFTTLVTNSVSLIPGKSSCLILTPNSFSINGQLFSISPSITASGAPQVQMVISFTAADAPEKSIRTNITKHATLIILLLFIFFSLLQWDKLIFLSKNLLLSRLAFLTSHPLLALSSSFYLLS